MDHLPNICKVYSLLVQQERQATIPLGESKVLAIPNSNQQQHSRDSQFKPTSNFRGRSNTRGEIFSGGRGKGNRVCTHYGMTNHICP